MDSVDKCIEYSESTGMDKYAERKFIRDVLLSNMCETKKFFASEEYTPLAKETYDRIRTLNEEELLKYKTSLENSPEDEEYCDEISKSVLINLVEIEIMFKDIEFMIKASL